VSEQHGLLARTGLDDLERRYLNGTFAELCRIESPSAGEAACAQRIRAELRALGLQVTEDDAGARVGADCGNLLARIPARASAAGATGEGPRRGVMLCAHMDTVPLAAPVQPRLRDGAWENANEGILGADNKAAVAVILALARRVCASGSPVDLELLFTISEEQGLAGARAFDARVLRSEIGYVFDHATPIGEIVIASPSHYRIEARLRGAAAHAGIRPESGRSAILAAAHAIAAMRLGRVDEQSTANVGIVSGGSEMNVVPEHCTIVAEARSLDEAHARELAAEIVQRIHEAANRPECECDVDIDLQPSFAGYRLSPQSAAVRIAEDALRACGYRPEHIQSGGASDANALIAQGFPTVNLANGTERNHEPGERVSVAALEGMLEVALALLDSAAAAPAAPGG
jgi:tripeptide aminopeptidase